MSLNWNVAKCANKDELIADVRKGNSLTKSVIFETMAVGLGSITAANVEEFQMRSDFARTLHGITARFTRAQIERHIGLVTNVSNETWTKFAKRHVTGWQCDWRYVNRKEVARAS